MKYVTYSLKAVVCIFALIGFLNTVSMVSNMFFRANAKLDRASVNHPLLSPSGKYMLQVLQGNNGNFKYNKFDITTISKNGMEYKIVFSCIDTFRSRDKLIFTWDNEDRVWVYSGDIGTFYWSKNTKGIWGKHSYSEEPIAVPETIRQKK